jgi:hypothetical protein
MPIANFLIIVIFLTGFFAGPFIERARYFSVILEISIYSLFVLSLFLKKGEKKLYLPYFYTCISMIMIGFFSMIVNGDLSIRFIFSIRNFYRFYFFFLALVNLPFNENNLKRLNIFVFIILLLQIPVVAIKFVMHGISELNIGTYQSHEGSLTTAVPLMAIIYLITYFAFHERRKSYILFAAGFLFWAVVGAKRAVLFLFPVVLMAMYIIISKRIKIDPSKHIRNIAAGLCVVLMFGAVVLATNPSFKPEEKAGVSIDPMYALDYAHKYETNDTERYTWGRYSTTKRVFSVIASSGIEHLFLGFGPGSFSPIFFDPPDWRSKYADLFNIRYGLTPLSLIAIEYGLFGIIPYALMTMHLIFMSYRLYKRETDRYWIAFACGSVGFSILMVYFFSMYHPPIWLGDTFPILFYYAMGVVFVRSTTLVAGEKNTERSPSPGWVK